MKRIIVLLLLVGCSDPKAQADGCYDVFTKEQSVYRHVTNLSQHRNYFEFAFSGRHVQVYGDSVVEESSCN